MGAEDDGRPIIFQTEDLLFENIDIDGVKAGEGFVEDQELRLVDHRDDELYLLLHPLAKLFHFLVPPCFDFEAAEPMPQAGHGVVPRQSFELGQVEGLLPNLHLFIKATFFRQVPNQGRIIGLELPAVEQQLSRIGPGDLVDDADQGRFTCPVRSEQPKDTLVGDLDADIVQCQVTGEGFSDMPGFKEVFHGVRLCMLSPGRILSSWRKSSFPYDWVVVGNWVNA